MFEPKIVAFLCTWCSYTGADGAGTARLKSSANLRAIRVPCSGRVSPEIIMRSFDQGADGVLVLACHIGECHYDTGNHRTARRLPVVRSLMAFTGMEPERLRLDWVSASEGERFARIANEFTEQVRSLGPAGWRMATPARLEPAIQWDRPAVPFTAVPSDAGAKPVAGAKTDAIRQVVSQLLANGEIDCAIGYEQGTHGRTRPIFIRQADQAERLVWNADCTHNLTTYLREKLKPGKDKQPARPVAVVAKPCDSRTINVLLAEKAFQREQVHVIGVVCEGVVDARDNLQERCAGCTERHPLVYDTLVGEASPWGCPPTLPIRQDQPLVPGILQLEVASPAERLEYWLSQFDRCIRCYACRQACPMCSCPTCLYERDDSTWVGMGTGVYEKRAFHLGRAYHLAGRCIDCHECEQVCPVGIPIGMLNQKLAQEMETAFNFRAGLEPAISPLITTLAGEYQAGGLEGCLEGRLEG